MRHPLSLLVSLLAYTVALATVVGTGLGPVGKAQARGLSENPALGLSDARPEPVQNRQALSTSERVLSSAPRAQVSGTPTPSSPFLFAFEPQQSLAASEDSVWEDGLEVRQRIGQRFAPLLEFPESPEAGGPSQPSYAPITFVHPWAAVADPYAFPAARLIAQDWSPLLRVGLPTKAPPDDLHGLPDEKGSKPLPALEATWLPQRIDDVKRSWHEWRYGSLFEPIGIKDSASEGTDIGAPANQLAVVRNPSVDRHLQFFYTTIKDRFQEWLLRLNRYQPRVEAIFDQFKLPKELVYLSLVESGFNPHAYSRAHAVGPWQFIRSTAGLYGLRVDQYVDERRDPIKSTIAAARYLKDLYDLFGTWPLAMAAYNAGEGRVSRALARTSGESYWTIASSRYLHRETKNYVPRFMAATIIATDPETYGFAMNSSDLHQFDEVVVPPLVHLRSIAQATGLSYAELKRLNPELRRNLTPPDGEGYLLKVPVGKSTLVLNHLEKIRSVKSHRYRVRWGDTLSTIARRFNITVSELKAFNNLRTNVIRAGQVLVVHPTRLPPPAGDRETQRYRVRWGDSLSTIAQRFGASVSHLKALNNLRSNIIRAGEVLEVHAAKPSPPVRDGKKHWYRVQWGDSLSTIAQRFGVSVSHLKALNNLRSDIIRAGEVLLLGFYGQGEPSDRPAWYRVRWGDSLWTIAKRFRTTVEQLKNFNNLSHHFIKAGDLLRIGP